MATPISASESPYVEETINVPSPSPGSPPPQAEVPLVFCSASLGDLRRSCVAVPIIEVKRRVRHGGVGLGSRIEGRAPCCPSASRVPSCHVVDHDIRVDPAGGDEERLRGVAEEI
ncbi:hypothetical protein E2C01_038143 [Portunus trituberculatus]|uniref:Uncharacterized protein n=1 Tax=Portunus trituberculatus TaxID=210409 RepID=A0A5B7FA25_PORTR|nr:hypothetical protein [Portunus trituberculatus]